MLEEGYSRGICESSRSRTSPSRRCDPDVPSLRKVYSSSETSALDRVGVGAGIYLLLSAVNCTNLGAKSISTSGGGRFLWVSMGHH